jgi:ABC-type sugar transport system permease subunit
MANQSIEPMLAKSATSGAPAIPATVVVAVPKFRRPGRLSHLLEQEHILAGALLAPTLIILTLFIAYPFVLGVWLAVSDKVVGRPGNFVGLQNFWVNLNDTIFLRAFQNTFVYALVFLSSPQQKTIPIGVFTELVRGDVFYWGPLMAGALLGSIPVALVYSFFVEHYVTALTGAVKG